MIKGMCKKITGRKALAVAALMTAAAVPAQADDGGFYLSGFVGLSQQDTQTNDSVNAIQGFDIGFDSGFTVGGSIGYKFNAPLISGFRVELEASYRENDVEDVFFGANTPTALGTATGDNSSFGVMANVLYDFSLPGGLISPYIGVGAGLGGVESDVILEGNDISLDAIPFDFGGPTRTRFLVQGIVGLTVPLSDTWDIFVDGRYFAAPGVDFSTDTGADLVGNVFDSEFSTLQVQTGLRFKF